MHCYKNALIRFRVRLMIPNCETHQIHQIPGQQTKCFIATYVFSLSYQLSYIWFPCYHYINYWFIHLFYIFCMLNVVKMWQGNIVLRNISGVTEGVHWVPLRYPREKNCPFYRNTKMLSKLSIYFLPHFHFSPAMGKCYNVFISTGCQNHS